MNMEVVKIPSKGKVVYLDGDAEILKKERSTGYQKVEVGTITSENDILWMKPGCIAKIEMLSVIVSRPLNSALVII